MPAVPWADGPSIDPTVHRLRRDAAHLMARGGAWALAAIAEGLRVQWGAQTPPEEWLSAALLGDPRLWRLPNGSWLHLGAVVGGRCMTTTPPEGWRAVGLIPEGLDLQAALLAFEGWERIPVTTDRGRGLLERGETASGRTVLVCPAALVPGGGALLAIVPGPEGVRLHAADVDEVADIRHRRALARRFRGHQALAGAPDVAMGLPRAWSTAEVLLALLAADPTACRAPTTPLSQLLAEGLGDGSVGVSGSVGVGRG